ncbi:hypothetical protein [Actinomadura formosensis]|nr:hypothetical protein [Actinomadura formosensis]
MSNRSAPAERTLTPARLGFHFPFSVNWLTDAPTKRSLIAYDH